MQPHFVKATIGAALIVGICSVVAAIARGILAIQANQIREQSVATATASIEQSEAKATEVARITPPPPPTSTPYPTSTPFPTATPYPTYTPLPTNTPIPTPIRTLPLPFTDDFKGGISKVWLREGGAWNMANNRLVNPGNDGIIWLGKQDWKDVVVELDVEHDWTCSGRGVTEVLLKDARPSQLCSSKNAKLQCRQRDGSCSKWKRHKENGWPFSRKAAGAFEN